MADLRDEAKGGNDHSNVSLFKKKSSAFKKVTFGGRGRGGSTFKGGMRRKRDESSDSSSGDDGEESSVVVAVKRPKKGVNSFSTGTGQEAEARAATREALAKDVMSANRFNSSRTAVPVKNAGDAFHYSEVDTEADRDARAILEKNVKLNKEGETNEQDGLYRGQAAYKNHIQKNESQIGANKHTGTQGPIRAPTFLRATCRFDYQPDICKDYKETGFCGFGDSCKFLHDRADYKTGWQMERDFEAKEKKRKEREALGDWAGDDGDDEEYLVDSDDDLPFACMICRQGFRDPVVTPCGHYFCQQCARDHHKTSPRCAVCGKQTSGVFNRAIKLLEKMRKRGLVTENPGAAEGGSGGGGGGGSNQKGDDEDNAGSDYEIREDGVELTDTGINRKAVGSWSAVKSEG